MHAARVVEENKAAILNIVEEEHMPKNLSEIDETKGKKLRKAGAVTSWYSCIHLWKMLQLKQEKE